jgi:hypothetical protein
MCEMKRAMAIDRGRAMSRAKAAAQMVPKTRGPTSPQKPEPSAEISAGSARKAGRLSATRKIATAARTARIAIPATSVETEKI